MPSALDPEFVGLCSDCVNMRKVASDRGSVFVFCELASSDARFEKYPRLPVHTCAGHVPGCPEQDPK